MTTIIGLCGSLRRESFNGMLLRAAIEMAPPGTAIEPESIREIPLYDAVERLGEARIAREAAGLRKEALNRIEELTAARADRDTPETERSGGVMTDDGGPPRKEE